MFDRHLFELLPRLKPADLLVITAPARPCTRLGQTEIATAAQAAEALRPLAAEAASVLFAIGIIAVGPRSAPSNQAETTATGTADSRDDSESIVLGDRGPVAQSNLRRGGFGDDGV
jgi:hypothetical protein